MNVLRRLVLIALAALPLTVLAGNFTVTDSPTGDDFMFAGDGSAKSILVAPDENRAVLRAAADLAGDIQRVTDIKPVVENQPAAPEKCGIIIGTIGQSAIIGQLIAAGRLATNGISGEWESCILQVVKNPLPGVDTALVIAGSDRRGTIFGIYQLSEMIGVSPWYWWADVPVTHQSKLGIHGNLLAQGPPSVKYRGIFINDEDWCLRPWASKTFDPATGNIGPKTYAKIFELLLRLHANYLWPAMHPGTAAFNSFTNDADLADSYGIVMGSSHCEQMLRNNVSEWDDKTYGEYNFVTNPDGVLKYWEDRVRTNGKFENVYTVGMRGIHDGAMPGGGTPQEKADRLRTIIRDQRKILGRLVNKNVAAVPQIFCPYKEVLELYRLAPDVPDDITLVWPDDNYGYVREFSNARERARSGGAGVYYHVSYWGRPNDYLWLCSTPPALIAEEMGKAYDYGADRVWILNVGDLKPAELDIEFFLNLAWDPHAWNGVNAYDLLGHQLARDFGAANAPALTSILSEYYRLNFQRKPEFMSFPTNSQFTASEMADRLAAWRNVVAQVDSMQTNLPPAARDAFFELIGYPVKAAAAMNDACLTGSTAAVDQIHQLTKKYNEQIAGGKWRGMMSDNPRQQIAYHQLAPGPDQRGLHTDIMGSGAADFLETNGQVILEAAHASKFVAGTDAVWRKLSGLGYHGEAVSVDPVTVATRNTPDTIFVGSPSLQYKIQFQSTGDWQAIMRALPTFSVETGQPQRFAIALDDAPPHIVALPVSMSETDRHWQENVLRNAALASSTFSVTQPGLHTLKIWMVDPGIVLDAIALQYGGPASLGYVWPPETRVRP